MTQREFTMRTLVEVSAEEFNAIHVVYLASDLDKDEFCKVWCKMNASRVTYAKNRKKEQKARFNRINKLMSVAGKLDVMMGHDKFGVEWLYELPTKSLTILHEENIEFSEFGRTKSAMTLRLDIKDKINKLASDELEK